MSQAAFSTAEVFLLQRWRESRRLEEAMIGCREKYQGVWERIRDRVVEEQPALDWHRLIVTQFWAKGQAGFGRKSWPGLEKNAVAGIWFENIRLEVLSDPDEPSPVAYLWLQPLQKAGFDTQRITSGAAESIAKLPQDLVTKSGLKEDSENAVVCSMPEKHELMNMLLQRDCQPFIDVVVERVNTLAQFVGLIDDAVAAGRK